MPRDGLGELPERVTHVINFASSAPAARHAARATASNSTSWRGTTFADFWADRAQLLTRGLALLATLPSISRPPPL